MFVWICLRGFDLKFCFKLECKILKRGRKILKHLMCVAGSLEALLLRFACSRRWSAVEGGADCPSATGYVKIFDVSDLKIKA